MVEGYKIVPDIDSMWVADQRGQAVSVRAVFGFVSSECVMGGSLELTGLPFPCLGSAFASSRVSSR